MIAFRTITTAMLVALIASFAWAEEKAGKPAAGNDSSKSKESKKEAFSAKEVQQLVRQLESGKYKERNDATNKLMTVGKAAIEPVHKAGYTDDLELGARCVDILKHYYQKGDADSKKAAGEALNKLKQSKHQSVAKWATEALGRPGIAGGLPLPFNRNRGGIQRMGRIGRIGAPRGFKREAKATDNGKEIHIVETIAPGNRQIVVKITEKVNGKEKTTEHTARTSAELRRKNKAVYDLYRKHIRGARIQMIGGNNLPLPRIGGAGGGFRRVTSRTVNGRREVTATEANRSVRISDTNDRDIEIKVTTTKNGKAETKTYKAKDLTELKKKHPEGAKIYEQYQRIGRAPMRFGGAFGNLRPRPAIPRPALPIAGNAAAQRKIDAARAKLDAAVKKLRDYATQTNPKPAELKRLAAEVRKAAGELQAATRELR